MPDTERKRRLEKFLCKKYIEDLNESIQNEEKCLIVEGICKIGKTTVINRWKEELENKNNSLVIFQKSPTKNLCETFCYVIKSLNEELPKKIRLRKNHILPNLANVYNISDATVTIEKIINDEDVKNYGGFLRVFIIIDDVDITKADAEQLESILNTLGRCQQDKYKFHIILSPKKPNDKLLNYKVIRISCLNKKETCEVFSDGINEDTIKDFFKLYRGHPWFINTALDNYNYITDTHPPDLRVDLEVARIFEEVADDISNFLKNHEDKPHLLYWCKCGLVYLFTFFLFCEEEICNNDFKGLNYNYLSNDFRQLVNELSYRSAHSETGDIEIPDNLSLKEALDKIFKFLGEESENLCKYLETDKHLENGKKYCKILYPPLINWLLENKNYLFDTSRDGYLSNKSFSKEVEDQFEESCRENKIRPLEACC